LFVKNRVPRAWQSPLALAFLWLVDGYEKVEKLICDIFLSRFVVAISVEQADGGDGGGRGRLLHHSYYIIMRVIFQLFYKFVRILLRIVKNYAILRMVEEAAAPPKPRDSPPIRPKK
jgi:hypothetical protein